MTRPLTTFLLILAISPRLAWSGWQMDGTPVCDLPRIQAQPVAIPDGAGGAFIAWSDMRNQASTWLDVYMQRLDGNGNPQWAVEGVLVCNAPREQGSLSIVSDNAGGAIVAWGDYRGDAARDVYAQRINSSGISQWTSNGVPVATTSLDESYPVMLPIGIGAVVIVWTQHDSETVSEYDIRGTRLSPSGVNLHPNGFSICSAPDMQDIPQIAPFQAGGAIIVWRDFRSSEGDFVSDIYANRLTSLGTILDGDGIPICDEPSHQGGPALVSDGGGAIIAWRDERLASGVYAQRLLPDGSMAWTDNGVQVNDPAFPYTYDTPKLVPDGAGGAIMAWTTTGASNDVYAQRIDPQGARLWGPGDVALCTASGSQVYLEVTRDNANGLIVIWSDRQVVQLDLYCQRVSSAGETLWGANGVAVCTAPFDQTFSPIVSDGYGGAIAVWHDFREDELGNDADIYAQRIYSGGQIWTGVTASPPSFTLVSNRPNPFGSSTEIQIQIENQTTVSIDVFDVAGRIVRHINVGALPTGFHRIPFDGTDNKRGNLPSGVYFYRVQAAGTVQTRKMVLLR